MGKPMGVGDGAEKPTQSEYGAMRAWFATKIGAGVLDSVLPVDGYNTMTRRDISNAVTDMIASFPKA